MSAGAKLPIAYRAESGRLRIRAGHTIVRNAEKLELPSIKVEVEGEGVVTLYMSPDGYVERKTA